MNTRLAYALLVFFIVVGLVTGVFLIDKNKPCTETYRTDTTIKFAGGQLSAQKEQTESAREKGLSGRACIGNKQAMLFVFDSSGYYPFWMKGMKFNIDIIWLNANKQVVYEANNVAPSTYPQNFVSDKPAKFVLEVAAANASKLGLQTGTQLSF